VRQADLCTNWSTHSPLSFDLADDHRAAFSIVLVGNQIAEQAALRTCWAGQVAKRTTGRCALLDDGRSRYQAAAADPDRLAGQSAGLTLLIFRSAPSDPPVRSGVFDLAPSLRS
jgi:hypothetical protein